MAACPTSTKNLSYDENDDVFIWKGSFEELRTVVNFILKVEDADSGEVLEDKKHNARTYKVGENSVRFYSSTQKLKLYGANHAQLRDSLLDLLSKQNPTPPLLPSPSLPTVEDVTVPAAAPSIRCEVEQIRAELNDLKRHVYSAMQYPIPSGSAKENMQISSLQDEIRTLRDANQHLTAKVEAANQKAAELENERNSLLTALRLFQTEYTESTARANDNLNQVEPGAEWTTVTRKKNKGSEEKRAPNKHTNARQNRQSQSNHSNQQRTRTERESNHETYTERKSTFIVGDSIISGLKGWRMSDKNNVVRVRSFPGATIEDMDDYIKPSSRASPDNLIIHIGTNNLPSDEPKQIVDKITKLAEAFQHSSPNTSIAISELAPRNDSGELNSKGKSVNRLLRPSCVSRGWTYLEHGLDAESLNSKGLHLNKKGTAQLATDLNKYIKSSC